ncbi:MAG: hypothetical protein ACOYXT_05975, partial [Bacteroidota bacterium]
MKRLLLITSMILVLASCEINYIEPRYDARNNVVGSYDVEEYSETYNDYTYYTLYISKSSYSREIYLENFYGTDIRVHAVLDYDKITIPYQVVNGYAVEGVGTLRGGDITLSYSVRDT